MKLSTLGGLSVVLSLATASIVSAATVINGGFEDDPGYAGLQNGNTFASMPASGGGATSWDIWDSANGYSGWTTLDYPLGIEIQTQNTVGLTPYEGDYYAELDSNNNSVISQLVNLGVGDYELSFAFSPRINSTTTNAIDVSLAPNILFHVVNGPGAGPPATSVGSWTLFTFGFSITQAGAYNLVFDAASQSDSLGGFLDDIQINKVPVPAAGFLLLGGLGGLAALRRRKKS